MSRSFSGTDVLTGSMVKLTTGGFSIGAWLYPTSASPDFARAFETTDNVQQFGYWDGSGSGGAFALSQKYSLGDTGARTAYGSPVLNTWQCVIAGGDGGGADDTKYWIWVGTQSTPMANAKGVGLGSPGGTRTISSTAVAHVGARSSGSLTWPGRIAQLFVLPWEMTDVEKERFRLGDWTVLYAHGTPRLFLPLQGAGLYDLSGSF